MKKETFTRLMFPVAVAGAVGAAMLGSAGVAAASTDPFVEVQHSAGTAHHTGPNYSGITGARIGAPSEQEVSTYGGSHKHLWVEQQLYGPGVVDVPQVDTTVHQSR